MSRFGPTSADAPSRSSLTVVARRYRRVLSVILTNVLTSGHNCTVCAPAGPRHHQQRERQHERTRGGPYRTHADGRVLDIDPSLKRPVTWTDATGHSAKHTGCHRSRPLGPAGFRAEIAAGLGTSSQTVRREAAGRLVRSTCGPAAAAAVSGVAAVGPGTADSVIPLTTHRQRARPTLCRRF